MSTVAPRFTFVPAGGFVAKGCPLAGPNASPTTSPAASSAATASSSDLPSTGGTSTMSGPFDTTTATSLSRRRGALTGAQADDLALLYVVAELVDLLGLELHGLQGGLGLGERLAGQPRRDGPRRGALGHHEWHVAALGQLGGHIGPHLDDDPGGDVLRLHLGDLRRELARIRQRLGGLIEGHADQVGGHGGGRVPGRHEHHQGAALVERLARRRIGVEDLAGVLPSRGIALASSSKPYSSTAACACASVIPISVGTS